MKILTVDGKVVLADGKVITPPTPSGTISITENGTVDVADYGTAVVNVAGGYGTVVGTLMADASIGTNGSLIIPRSMLEMDHVYYFVCSNPSVLDNTAHIRKVCMFASRNTAGTAVSTLSGVHFRKDNGTSSCKSTYDSENEQFRIAGSGSYRYSAGQIFTVYKSMKIPEEI